MTAPSAVDAQAFRQALGQFASGVTVVTTEGPDGPLGLTVTAFSSLSLDPPLVLVCIDRRSEAHAGFERGAFAISLLAEGQEPVSQRFAWGGAAKFAGGGLLTGESGLVLVEGALAHLECRVHASMPGGDHVIYVGLVERVAVSEGRPLLHHARGYRCLERDAT
ncbi:MAG: flavin reductase family protein [Vicinamibacteria bacterium]